MKYLYLTLLLCCNMSMTMANIWSSSELKSQVNLNEPQATRAVSSLNGLWQMSPLKRTKICPDVLIEAKNGKQNPKYSVDKWRKVKVPHYNWFRFDPNTYPNKAKKYVGYSFSSKDSTYVNGWFSKNFTVPATLEGKRIYLKFGSIAWESHIWVNGHKIAMHRGSFTGFKLDVTKYIKFGKDNILRIWAYNDFGERPPRHAYGKMFFPTSNIGGIHGGVEIEALQPVNVSSCLITPQLKNNTVELDLTINNPLNKKLTTKVYALLQGGVNRKYAKAKKIFLGELQLSAKTTKKSFILKLNKPVLWTPKTPYLYKTFIVLENKQNNKAICSYENRFGFRDFKIKGKKFFLNGKRIRIYCGNILTAGSWDNFSPDNGKSRKMIQRQKRQGANTIRYHMSGADSHHMLQMADEEGMLVISEFPLFHRIFHELTFPTPTARKEFMDNILYEWKAHFYRDYNHPSCVIWSLSNEVWTDSTVDELNEIYSAIKPLDKQDRPMSAGSGIHSFGIPTMPVKTDFWDAHLYNLVSHIPYTFAKVDFDRYFGDLKKVYGKLKHLSVAFECLALGYGKPSKKIAFDRSLSVKEYLRLIKKNKTGDKNWLGLRHFLDWRDSGMYLLNYISKKSIEEFRKETRLQGFHPWWIRRDIICPSYKIITSPLFIGAKALPVNQFAGKNFSFDTVLIKDPLRKINANCVFSISNKQQGIIIKQQVNIRLPKNNDKTIKNINIKIPTTTKTGFYKLNMTLKEASKVWCKNTYRVFILNPADLPKLHSKSAKLAVYENKNVVKTILKNKKVKFAALKTFAELKNYSHLIVYVSTPQAVKKLTSAGGTIREWVKKGGKLLIIELPTSTPLDWIFEGYKIINDEEAFTTTSLICEPVERKHPVFKGLSVSNFTTLNGNNGVVGNALIYPLTNNVLGAGFPCSKTGPGGLLYEASVGKGSCIISQVIALERYNSDSSATLYLHNLLNYFNEKKQAKLKPLQKAKQSGIIKLLSSIPLNECELIDISKAANRSFQDDVAGDGKGGWTDAGNSDFRHAPIGKNKFLNIPFKLINPKDNNNKAAIILCGSKTPKFPKAITLGNINKRLRRLFFLQTTWYPKHNEKMFEYQINYANGTKLNIPVIAGKDVGDWFAPFDKLNAPVAWQKSHPVVNAPFGFYLMTWKNPYPAQKIKHIKIVSSGIGVPIILGITGQKYVEYAESKLKYPWDFSRKDTITQKWKTSLLSSHKGIYSFKLSAHAWLGFNLYNKKFDANKWQHLMFSLKASNPVKVKILYFSPSGDRGTSNAIKPVETINGWNYYDIPLHKIWWRWGTSPKAKQWGGRDHTVSTLAIDLTPTKTTTIQLKPLMLFKD